MLNRHCGKDHEHIQCGGSDLRKTEEYTDEMVDVIHNGFSTHLRSAARVRVPALCANVCTRGPYYSSPRLPLVSLRPRPGALAIAPGGGCPPLRFTPVLPYEVNLNIWQTCGRLDALRGLMGPKRPPPPGGVALPLAAQPPKEAVQALVLLLAARRAHVVNPLMTLLPGEAAGSTPSGGAPTETSALPKLVLLLAARPRRVLLLAARPRRRGREEGACLHGLPLRLFLSSNPSPRLTRPPVLLLAARREKGERRGKGGSLVPLPAARGGVLAPRLRPRLCDRVLLPAARFPRPRMPKRYACVAAGSQRPQGSAPSSATASGGAGPRPGTHHVVAAPHPLCGCARASLQPTVGRGNEEGPDGRVCVRVCTGNIGTKACS